MEYNSGSNGREEWEKEPTNEVTGKKGKEASGKKGGSMKITPKELNHNISVDKCDNWNNITSMRI